MRLFCQRTSVHILLITIILFIFLENRRRRRIKNRWQKLVYTIIFAIKNKVRHEKEQRSTVFSQHLQDVKLEQEEGDLESEEFSHEDLPEEYSDEMGDELEDD